jgi:hypothetical protein
MADLSGFNAEAPENNASSVIPAGEYEAIITSSEKKDTKSGGAYLNMEFQITKGPMQNRRHFEKLNMWNANETAVQIARSTLSKICRAVGVLNPNDSSELHNKPMVIKLKVKDGGEYGPQNQIADIKPRAFVAPQQQQVQQAPVPQSSGAPGW